MPNSEEHKLDVDLEVIEEPVDDFFPREPNTVSHRMHEVKITAVIRDVPDGTAQLELEAEVLAHGKQTVGEKGHASTEVQTWGTIRPVTIPYPIDGCPVLPCRIDLIVSRTLEDDHLGEGPFQAFVKISASNVPPDGPTPPNAASTTNTTADDGPMKYSINFVSK